MSALTERLPRLLALVPYLLSHPGVGVRDAAHEFGITPDQLRSDLNLLWMCGLPGYGPGELIDLSFEGDTIDVVFDAGMHRPLRLTRGEAGALAVALRSLGEIGGLVDTEVVERALAKVEAAAGGSGRPNPVAVGTDEEDPATTRHLRATTAALAAALSTHRLVHLRYYSASRDDITERDVEPWRLLSVAGHTYLAGWCRRVSDERLFRIDRIDRVEVRDEVVAPAETSGHGDGAPFDLGDDLPVAEIEVARTHAWVAEYYPVESTELTPEGTLRVRLRYADEEWLLRLVLGLGAGARIVRPALVAELLRERAAAALRAYG